MRLATEAQPEGGMPAEYTPRWWPQRVRTPV